MTNAAITDVNAYMADVGARARAASRTIASASTEVKNTALLAIAAELDRARVLLVAENQKDLAAGRANGLDAAMLDRLTVKPATVDAMIEGLRQVAGLKDPCGAISDLNMLPSGIQVGRMRIPLGVIGIIYESRPNVTIDAASLCLKSGNAVILRGGSEAINSNRAIAACVHAGLKVAGLPADVVQVVATTDRAAVGALITMPEFVDVIIPRGGKSLIERISREARVPVIKHLDGICHVYIDESADLQKAFDVTMNSKTHRYGVCNALETLLVNRAVAPAILPRLAEALTEKGVELRGCDATCAIISANVATDEDWATEYLAPILSIKIVADLDEAMAHIQQYSSKHTESIITENFSRAQRFLREVDSSSVMVNASTRFADGFQYGLGAEIGISTDKIHAYGPVGLEGLTTLKWIVLGSGQVRQ